MRRGTTISLYELFWILPSIAIPVGVLVALVVFAFGTGVHPPGHERRWEPTAVLATPPFDQPGTVQIGPGQYEVRMIGGIWLFTPNEIRVPVGSTVPFVAARPDVLHGRSIP